METEPCHVTILRMRRLRFRSSNRDWGRVFEFSFNQKLILISRTEFLHAQVYPLSARWTFLDAQVSLVKGDVHVVFFSN